MKVLLKNVFLCGMEFVLEIEQLHVQRRTSGIYTKGIGTNLVNNYRHKQQYLDRTVIVLEERELNDIDPYFYLSFSDLNELNTFKIGSE